MRLKFVPSACNRCALQFAEVVGAVPAYTSKSVAVARSHPDILIARKKWWENMAVSLNASGFFRANSAGCTITTTQSGQSRKETTSNIAPRPDLTRGAVPSQVAIAG